MTDCFRRGQVEWALWRLKRGDAKSRPPSQFLARIKRLFDIDRGLAPEGERGWYAFSEYAPGGRGENAEFSKLDALLLWLALELLELGFKQQEVVEQMRRARPLLGRELKPLLNASPLRIRVGKQAASAETDTAGPSEASLRRFLVLPQIEVAPYPWTLPIKHMQGKASAMLMSPEQVLAVLNKGAQMKLVVVPAALPAFEINGLLERAPAIQGGRPFRPAHET